MPKKCIEVVITEGVEELLRQALPEKYRLQFDVMVGLALRSSEPNRIHLSDVYLNATSEDFPDFFRAVYSAGVKVFGLVDIKYQRSRVTLAEAKAKTVGLVGVLSEKTQIGLAKAWIEANEKGQTCLFEHISPLSFHSAFQVAVSKLPPEYRHLSPHDLRHTFLYAGCSGSSRAL